MFPSEKLGLNLSPEIFGRNIRTRQMGLLGETNQSEVLISEKENLEKLVANVDLRSIYEKAFLSEHQGIKRTSLSNISIDEMSAMNLCYKVAPMLQKYLNNNRNFTNKFSLEYIDTGNGMDHADQHCTLIAKSKTTGRRYLIDAMYKQFQKDELTQNPNVLVLELTNRATFQIDWLKRSLNKKVCDILFRYILPKTSHYKHRNALHTMLHYDQAERTKRDNFAALIDESYEYLKTKLIEQYPQKEIQAIEDLILCHFFERTLSRIRPVVYNFFGTEIKATPLINAEAVKRVKETIELEQIPDEEDLKATLKEMGLNNENISSTVTAINNALTSFTEEKRSSMLLINNPI